VRFAIASSSRARRGFGPPRLRLSFALSFFVIVAAEFIAAERGLGFLINDAREFFRVDRMLLGAAAIGLLGYGFNQLFGRLERALVPWKD